MKAAELLKLAGILFFVVICMVVFGVSDVNEGFSTNVDTNYKHGTNPNADFHDVPENAKVSYNNGNFSDTVTYKVMDAPALKLTVTASTDAGEGTSGQGPTGGTSGGSVGQGSTGGTSVSVPKLTGSVSLQDEENNKMMWEVVGMSGMTIDAENECSTIHVTINLSYEPALVTTILKNGNKKVNPSELLKSKWCEPENNSSPGARARSEPRVPREPQGYSPASSYEVIMKI